MLDRPPENPYERQLLQAEKCIIESALTVTGTRIFAAAVLGISNEFLQDRMVLLGIEFEDEPEDATTPYEAPPEDMEVSCSDCGITGTVSNLPPHLPGCPSQGVAGQVAVPVAAASAVPVFPPPTAFAPPPPAPSNAAPSASAPEGKQKRKRKPMTEEQKVIARASLARAREARYKNKSNVLPFVAKEESKATKGEPSIPEYADLIESELTFCSCARNPATCPVHRLGGGRDQRHEDDND